MANKQGMVCEFKYEICIRTYEFVLISALKNMLSDQVKRQKWDKSLQSKFPQLVHNAFVEVFTSYEEEKHQFITSDQPLFEILFFNDQLYQ